MKLTAANVTTTLMACLYEDSQIENGKPKDGMPEPLLVQGLRTNIGFNPDRVKLQVDNIKAMLDCLPDDAKTSEGISFLNLCMDKDGQQWGEHRNMDELVVLGIASKLIQPLMPRMIWAALPGSMPYIFFEEVKNESI